MSEKNYDDHNRWRNKTVAFRMSPEESEQLDKFVKLSGYTKQDYLIKRALQQEVKVVGNPRVFKALKNQMAEIEAQQNELIDATKEHNKQDYTNW